MIRNKMGTHNSLEMVAVQGSPCSPTHSSNSRYNEHVHAIRTNNERTGKSHHILSTYHSFGNLENNL
jgi:hypothetical protein